MSHKNIKDHFWQLSPLRAELMIFWRPTRGTWRCRFGMTRPRGRVAVNLIILEIDEKEIGPQVKHWIFHFHLFVHSNLKESEMTKKLLWIWRKEILNWPDIDSHRGERKRKHLSVAAKEGKWRDYGNLRIGAGSFFQKAYRKRKKIKKLKEYITRVRV